MTYKERFRKAVTLQRLCDDYMGSLSYERLSPATRRDYALWMANCIATIGATTKVVTIDTPIAQQHYNLWAEQRGVPTANHIRSVMSRVFNFSIQVGSCFHNPFALIAKLSHRSRKETWTKEQVKQFLEVAFKEFKWRSVGMIVYMAYTWGQRLGDMRELKWENYSFDDRVLKLEQSKRRARVELPTTDSLHDLLVKQHEDMGFQPYIAPKITYGKIKEEPYDKVMLGTIGRDIREAAGLPDTLQLMDMRRTAITEMVDAGVSLPQIMAVSGHENPQSVKPYMKNTLTSSSEACRLRLEAGGGDIL